MEKGSPPPAEVPMHEQEKQGGKCCGGCCDYRRAVIVLCIISLVFSVIGIINPSLNQAYQDQEYPELEQIVKDHSTNLLIMGIVHIIMTVIALVGAVIFNFFMVAIYVFWSILNLIISIVLQQQMVGELLDWVEKQTDDASWSASNQDELESSFNTYMIMNYVITAILTLLWVYPSVFLSVEIKKGIMTKETYPREEMSCCCVANRR
mmetsp:Transcript_18957/g.46948  ORF Transcript_18957/g.46948 Transcript_18957/m.46948 type:complete len:207 (+) Transcript_18957:1161-1781(+)